MPLVTLEHVAFSYEGQEVVSGLHFSISRGDYICVLGENGAGKTTLVKGLLHLKQPSAGRIVLGDGLRPNQIGYLPQRAPAERNFPASVFEVVLSGRLNTRGLRPFYSETDRRVARENMERMGISGMQNKSYRMLSGGQQQRVLLSRALCATGTMLLLDEPVAGLDPVAAGELYRLIDEINKEMGITIVMVSHDIHSAVRHASHVLQLQHRQVFYGTAEAYGQTQAAQAWAREKVEAHD